MSPKRLLLCSNGKIYQRGTDHGGPLLLFHQAAGPAGAFWVVKWPSYGQWAGVGTRSSNKVEYWLVHVIHTDNAESRYNGRQGVFRRVAVLKEITPGRKRALVDELVYKAEVLASGKETPESLI